MPASSEHPIYEGRKLRERVFCQGECCKNSRILREFTMHSNVGPDGCSVRSSLFELKLVDL
jgi:hypothetical protein